MTSARQYFIVGVREAHMGRLWSRMESSYSDIDDECPAAVNITIEPF